MKASALALAILLAVPGCSARADVPAQGDESIRQVAHLPARPVGPLLDQADILPAPDEAMLDRRLREQWRKHRVPVVVATVPSLGGQSIERYANDLARAWGIGDPKTMQGVLFLIAPNERKVRIEVACGSEARVSDVAAGRIIRDVVVPAYKAGNLSGGTIAGTDAIIDRLGHPQPADDLDPKQPGCPGQLKVAA